MLTNQDNRKKQEITYPRTSQDAVTRSASNIKIMEDEVKGLTVEVSDKVDKTKVITTINASTEGVKIQAPKVDLTGYVTVTDLSTGGRTTINGSNITTGTISANRVSGGTLTGTTISGNTISGNTITGGSITGTTISNGNAFSVDSSGKVSTSDIDITGGSIVLTRNNTGQGSPFTILQNYQGVEYKMQMGAGALNFYTGGTRRASFSAGTTDARLFMSGSDNVQRISAYGNSGNITCVSLTQTSKEEEKKNFKKLENALNIVKDVDIYEYNLKFEKDKDKKHIGFVIGNNFNYRKEITSENNDGVDTYSMVSVLWKAVQEQQAEIEELKKVIK